MKTIRKTKKQLMDELAELQARLSKFKAREKEAADARLDFIEKFGLSFPRTELSNEAIYVMFDRKYEFVNKKFAEMFGYSVEEICDAGFDPMKLVAQESRQLVRDKHRLGYRGEFADQEFEFTGMTKEGLTIECETYMLIIPYKWGVAIHGVTRNISVQKRINEELQRNRSDLQIVLDSIPTSVFYTDKEHRFLRVNSTLCKALGYSLEQIIGKTLTELFPNLPPEQLSHFYESSNEVMRSGHPKRGFIEIMPSVRGRRWFQNDRLPFFNEEGKISGVICVAIDISDIRKTEEKLQYLSFHDVLTGLYNRTYFEEEMCRLEKGRQFPISVVAVKLQDLQTVNEREGVDEGNDLLKNAAKVLKSFRSEDIVARISGDRFAALLPVAERAIAEKIVARLNHALEVHNTRCKGMRPLRLSFGTACGEKGCRLADILKQAEDASKQAAHDT